LNEQDLLRDAVQKYVKEDEGKDLYTCWLKDPRISMIQTPNKHSENLRRALPQYSECGSPQATFENQFFFRRRIANIANFSTPTPLFDTK